MDIYFLNCLSLSVRTQIVDRERVSSSFVAETNKIHITVIGSGLRLVPFYFRVYIHNSHMQQNYIIACPRPNLLDTRYDNVIETNIPPGTIRDAVHLGAVIPHHWLL